MLFAFIQSRYAPASNVLPAILQLLDSYYRLLSGIAHNV